MIRHTCREYITGRKSRTSKGHLMIDEECEKVPEYKITEFRRILQIIHKRTSFKEFSIPGNEAKRILKNMNYRNILIYLSEEFLPISK